MGRICHKEYICVQFFRFYKDTDIFLVILQSLTYFHRHTRERGIMGYLCLVNRGIR